MVSGPLQNVSVQYRNRGYIGDRVFPILDLDSPAAKITTYDKGAWFRDEASQRERGTRAKRGGYGTGSVSIDAFERAFAKEVTDEDRDEARLANTAPLNLEMDAIEFSTDKIMLEKEKRIASTIFSATWSGGNEDAGGLWAKDTHAAHVGGSGDNTFIHDVETRIDTIRANTGFRPNVLLMDATTFSHIKQEPTVLERIKYVQQGIVSGELIASLFGLDEVLVGDAIYSSAKEKKDGTDFTSVDIWEKNSGKGSAFLFYRPRRPGLKIPSAGYQVRIRYGANVGGGVRRTMSWREDAEHQDVYEVAEKTDILQVASYAGFLWYDTIST
jgi:hypothetical protein